jgi:rhodanese-related sulfurtransferase
MSKSKTTNKANPTKSASHPMTELLTTLTQNPILLIGLMLLVGVVVIAMTSGGGSPAATATNGTQIAFISPSQYQERYKAEPTTHLLLDVRTPEEFATGHIPGAVNISVESLESRLSEVPQGVPVVVYCRSGNRSQTASRILMNAGYGEVYDLGGIIRWQSQGLPVE